MKQTFASFSFGCRVNQAEKEEIDRQLQSQGYRWDEADPSFYIVNTCSVTHKAEREAKQHIYQARRRYPQTKIVVTGCAVTNWLKQDKGGKREPEYDMPEADMLVDNIHKEYLVSLMLKRFGGTAHAPATLHTTPDKFLDSGRVIVKIQDGCQRFCTFCIVPYLRGLPKSRSTDSIITSIDEWSGSMQEVIMTAINTQAFGYDTKENFIDLVRRTLEETSIARLSFGSIHPWSIDDDFFRLYETYKADDRLIDFFHIPLQSGCDKILKLMKRGYTRGEFMEKLDRIARMNPMAFIGTDVIVGFLEETDADFAETYEFLEKTPISKFHVFRFSPREHTAANYLRQRLTEPSVQDKQKRAKALAVLGRRKYSRFLQKHVNKTMKALYLEKTNEDGFRLALLDNQVPAVVNAPQTQGGEIGNVKILRMRNDNLIGKSI